MKTRKLGRLSYAHVLRARDGIERALKDQGVGALGGIDGEAKRRYSLFRRACSALDVEAKTYVVNDTPEAKIGKLGAGVGRLWFVLRRMLQELARLADVLPAGEEAERAHRKFFPDGLLFVNQGAQVEIHHGKALLAEIEAHVFSPYLSTMLAPILVRPREEQLVYEVALGEKLVTVKRTPRAPPPAHRGNRGACRLCRLRRSHRDGRRVPSASRRDFGPGGSSARDGAAVERRACGEGERGGRAECGADGRAD